MFNCPLILLFYKTHENNITYLKSNFLVLLFPCFKYDLNPYLLSQK